jgi:hypothetical protein
MGVRGGGGVTSTKATFLSNWGEKWELRVAKYLPLFSEDNFLVPDYIDIVE